jgi:hypothetical protein
MTALSAMLDRAARPMACPDDLRPPLRIRTDGLNGCDLIAVQASYLTAATVRERVEVGDASRLGDGAQLVIFRPASIGTNAQPPRSQRAAKSPPARRTDERHPGSSHCQH